MDAYGPPLTDSRKSALYGPPPWHFAGRAVSIYFRAPEDAVDALLPPPLRQTDDPVRRGICRATVQEFVCDYGLGDDLVWTNPERALCREGLIALPAMYGDLHGEVDVVLWCDNDAEFAASREMFGWPQKLGRVHLSWPFHSHAGEGARLRGVVSRHGRRLITADIELERQVDPADMPAWGSFLCVRLLPSSSPGGIDVHEVLEEELGSKSLLDVWSGAGSVELGEADDEEVALLGPLEVVSAYYFRHEWLKMPSRLVERIG
ncbi:MAG TPA: acetoacetate decarboxylase family protein [Gaiellaceae bacterium]|nr:acetoacetate decarboxylase family protein [Gaiellaceae bacterium]